MDTSTGKGAGSRHSWASRLTAISGATGYLLSPCGRQSSLGKKIGKRSLHFCDGQPACGCRRIHRMAKTKSDVLRIAAVGLGWVTTSRHIPAVQRTEGTVLAGVIDPNPEKVEAARRRFRVLRGSATADPDRIDWLDEIDAVTIGTPPPTHFALAREFLRRGKHVLVEKPMTTTPAEAQVLIDTASSAGRMLAVVHNFQFAKSIMRLRRLLEQGKLGEIRGIMGVQLSNPRRRLPAWYEDLALGLFTDESPHLLYLVHALARAELRLDHAEILPSPASQRTPQLVQMLLNGGGIPVQLTMHFDAPLSEWHVAVLGTRGMAVADIFRDVLVMTGNDGAHHAPDILRTSLAAASSHFRGTIASGVRLSAHSLLYGNDEVMVRFAAACRDGVAPLGIAAADGLRVVELQHQVTNGARRLAA